MNKCVTLTFVVATLFLCLVSGQELSPLEKFLAHSITPLVEYSAIREMEARNSDGKVVAELKAFTVLSNGKEMNYRIESERHEGLGGSKASEQLVKILEEEKAQAQNSSFEKSGFTRENYVFTKTENVSDFFLVSLRAQRKGGLFINGLLFLDKQGRLLRSEGILTKNPSFMTSDVLVVVTYEEIFGARVPVSYDSRAKIRFGFGKWTMSSRYTYLSVNGFKVNLDK